MRLRSARSEIWVQSSSGFAELLKALLVPWFADCLGIGTGGYENVCLDMVDGLIVLELEVGIQYV
jgi:hypothetical protein